MGNGLSPTRGLLAVVVIGMAVLTGAAAPVQAYVIDSFTAVNNPTFTQVSPAPPPTIWSFSKSFPNPADGWAAVTSIPGMVPTATTGRVADSGIANVFGGNRTVTSATPNARMSQPVGFAVDTVNGLLSSFTASQSSTTLTLSYGPIDLNGATAIEVDYRADHDATADLEINGLPADGTQSLIGDALFHTLIFPISGFGISTMDLIFNANPQALDFELFEVRTQIIPEPLSLAIWLLTGLAGVGLVRVCRRREK